MKIDELKKMKLENYRILAEEISRDQSKWAPYFESLALYYGRAFISNLPRLAHIINKFKNTENLPDQKQKNEKIRKEIVKFFQAYNALGIQADGSLKINQKIMDNFQLIKNKREKQEENLIIEGLNLEKYSIMGEKFTLNQLMNIFINFYKNQEVREKFFENILNESKEKIESKKLSETIPMFVMKQSIFEPLYAY